MEFHPSQLPIAKSYVANDVNEASEIAAELVNLGFENRTEGFKVLMPKEKNLAKRIGYTLTTSVSTGLRQTKQERNIRYWTYHQDNEHYAIVLISSQALAKLGF